MQAVTLSGEGAGETKAEVCIIEGDDFKVQRYGDKISLTAFQSPNPDIRATFSDKGMKKMIEAEKNNIPCEIRFPEEVTVIDNNYHYRKSSLAYNGLKKGLQGKIIFGKNLEYINDDSFSGNTEVTAIEIKSGKSYLRFGARNFSAGSNPNSVNNVDSIIAGKSKMEGVERSKLREIKFGKRDEGYYLGDFAFAKSDLDVLDFSENDMSSISMGDFTFYDSNIKDIRGEEAILTAGNCAFEKNLIEELDFSRLEGRSLWFRARAFADNPNLKRLLFPKTMFQLRFWSHTFTGCNIEGPLYLPNIGGELEYPYVDTRGSGVHLFGSNFEGNKITELRFPDYDYKDNVFSSREPLNAVDFAPNILKDNPIERLTNVDLYARYYNDLSDSESASAFSGFEKRNIKNITFRRDYLTYNSEIKGVMRTTYVAKSSKIMIRDLFQNQALRSLIFPRFVTKMHEDYKPFIGNKGWIKGDSRVALYQMDRDDKYSMDNALKDGEGFVVNPVYVKFDLLNQFHGSMKTRVSEAISGKRKRTEREFYSTNGYKETENEKDVAISSYESKLDFKLGDRFVFQAPAVEGLVAKAVYVGDEEFSPKTDGSFEITIRPENVKEVKYDERQDENFDEGYDVGYMEAKIRVLYEVPTKKILIKSNKRVKDRLQTVRVIAKKGSTETVIEVPVTNFVDKGENEFEVEVEVPAEKDTVYEVKSTAEEFYEPYTVKEEKQTGFDDVFRIKSKYLVRVYTDKEGKDIMKGFTIFGVLADKREVSLFDTASLTEDIFKANTEEADGTKAYGRESFLAMEDDKNQFFTDYKVVAKEVAGYTLTVKKEEGGKHLHTFLITAKAVQNIGGGDPLPVKPEGPKTPTSPETPKTPTPIEPTIPSSPSVPDYPILPGTPSIIIPEPPEIIPVDEVEIPKSEAVIEPFTADEEPPSAEVIDTPSEEEVENLEIIGDETPRGSTDLPDKSKKVLAKTGGSQVNFYRILSCFLVLILMLGSLEFSKRNKQ